MIGSQLQSAAARDPHAAFLIDCERTWSRTESWSRVQRLARGLCATSAQRVLAYMDDSADLVHLLIAASIAGKTFTIANRLSPPPELVALASTISAELIITPDPIAAITIPQTSLHTLCDHGELGTNTQDLSTAGEPGELVILTSGTTGRPKGAAYSWERLLSQVHSRKDQVGTRWILLYQLNHFAGFQMLAHVAAHAACLVIPKSLDVDHISNEIKRHAVTHASGTPTFWRLFAGIQRDTLPSLRQITLGGEASTADLLEKLRRLFPNASISQVYATTELGSCFSTTDGKPGFPASLLNDNDRAIPLRVIDGQLYAHSDHGMKGYVTTDDAAATCIRTADGWVATGDLVEQVGERIFFRGRVSETINVGGIKVHPLQVEECILAVPGVLAARVFGKPNPITGAIVTAEIVCEANHTPEKVVEAVHAACRLCCTRYQRPRTISVVPSLSTVNRKTRRLSASGAIMSAPATDAAP